MRMVPQPIFQHAIAPVVPGGHGMSPLDSNPWVSCRGAQSSASHLYQHFKPSLHVGASKRLAQCSPEMKRRIWDSSSGLTASLSPLLML